MLGWQVEQERKDDAKYDVSLIIRVRFNGRAWPDILRNRRYRDTIYRLVIYRLNELWDDELEEERWKETSGTYVKERGSGFAQPSTDIKRPTGPIHEEGTDT
jgi:hypothetical protein